MRLFGLKQNPVHTHENLSKLRKSVHPWGIKPFAKKLSQLFILFFKVFILPEICNGDPRTSIAQLKDNKITCSLIITYTEVLYELKFF